MGVRIGKRIQFWREGLVEILLRKQAPGGKHLVKHVSGSPKVLL